MADEDLPFHAVIDLTPGDLRRPTTLAVMCNARRFCIVVSADDLELSKAGGAGQPSQLKQDYLTHLNALEDESYDGNAPEELEDWILDPCLPYFKEAAGQKIKHSTALTLQDYYDPVTIVLKLVNDENNHLKAVHDPSYDTNDLRYLDPKVPPSSMKLQLPTSLPRFKASRLEILPSSDPMGDCTSDIPHVVRTPDGERLFFKAALERQSFEREIGILLRPEYQALVSKNVRVSRLRGIVEWEKDTACMGMLLEMIHDNGDSLMFAKEELSLARREQLMQQIHHTVDQLHRVGIAWGDVKPDNIVIDQDGMPWIVDFGGGCAKGWVDHELSETIEGDLQGLLKIRQYLGLD